MKEFKYTINGNVYNVHIEEVEGEVAKVEVNGTPYKVMLEEKKKPFKPVISKPAAAPTTASGQRVVSRPVKKAALGALKSPLPGVILEVSVKVGDVVKKGQKVLVLEAMKMENNITADREGKVVDVKVNKGDSVLEGADLVIIE